MRRPPDAERRVTGGPRPLRCQIGAAHDDPLDMALSSATGAARTLRVLIGEQPGAHQPLVCCATDGLTPLGRELLRPGWLREDVRRLRDLASELSATADGAPRIALVELDDGPRPLVLIAPGGEGWVAADVAAVARAALGEADAAWGSPVVRLAHPFPSGWPPQATQAFLDGICDLLAERELALEEVHVDRCCLTDPSVLLEAAGRARPTPDPKPLRVDEVEARDGVRILEARCAEQRGPARGRLVALTAKVVGASTGHDAALRCRAIDLHATGAAEGEGGVLVSNLPDLDRLTVLLPGRVSDGALEEDWVRVGEDFRYLLDPRSRQVYGFDLFNVSEFDFDDPQYEAIWRPPLFDAPILGLSGASAGLIAAAARLTYGDEDTPNRVLFHAALDAQERGGRQAALELWQACLATGDEMARFAVGYTLAGLGRFREAHDALRHYCRTDENNAWAWVWLGRACEGLEDWEGAEFAYREAIRLDAAGSFETDAEEWLAKLRARRSRKEPG